MMARHQLGKELPAPKVASILIWLTALTGEIPREYIQKPELPAEGPVLLVADPGLKSSGLIDEAAGALRKGGLEVSLFTQLQSDPTIAQALAAEGATVAVAARRRDRLEALVERIGNDAEVLVIGGKNSAAIFAYPSSSSSTMTCFL